MEHQKHMVQWNHAFLEVQGVSKYTDLNPVHGSSMSSHVVSSPPSPDESHMLGKAQVTQQTVVQSRQFWHLGDSSNCTLYLLFWFLQKDVCTARMQQGSS
ncbi:hypothetical protein E2C01_049776 [Portunus trituberculatus]|uniref:Uncharacterized protein n=1 Tax=Portunus trituberculatus TaxID=210409 RepID=A0A5B7G7A4_PORTR|nr:hypothetical protein [Portunus trituberculatus]